MWEAGQEKHSLLNVVCSSVIFAGNCYEVFFVSLSIRSLILSEA